MKIITLNLEGIENAAKRGFFDWMLDQAADVVCVQQTLAWEHELTDPVFFPKGYHAHFFDAYEKAWGGTAIYVRKQPKAVMRGIGQMEVDAMGRYMQADYDRISVVSLAIPCVFDGSDEALAAAPAMRRKLLTQLGKVRNKRREFILCGDWQVAHLDIDSLNSSAGADNRCLDPELQDWMDDLLDGAGYADAFREIDMDTDRYTWFPAQPERPEHQRDAWRVDYQIVTSSLRRRVRSAWIAEDAVFSDHRPLVVEYDLEL